MANAIEIWTNFTALDRSDPFAFFERARMLEADGWDGATFPDSHQVNPEVVSMLGACTQITSRLRLGTGVTNPSTRHPAVVASAMMTLNAISGDRIVLGIGRGDSPLAYCGGSPVSIKDFEAALEMIRAYMKGETVPLELAATALARNSRVGFGDDLAMNHAPEGSLIKWIKPSHRRPPVEVICTGPKVIQIAARQADHITFALGADVERLAWAVGVAKEELARIGRDPADIIFGAHIPTFPHHDQAVARKLAEGYVTAQARFGVMTNKVVGPADAGQRANFERLAGNYDMRAHGMIGSAQARVLDDDFIDAFGLIGDPAAAVERLKRIVALGITKLQLVTSQASTDDGRASYGLATTEIMPAIRAAA
ncbi:LLM class flavin-dependent oxidoreductase [Rhizorhabdus dicambivorans]|uniref:LLM class flavin-dependent oxidoreductase n=1 Tax=Rhizorhabdus dicambivorans TaxID=1850238 RepID=A0A2A4G2W3_9SPHN|nr:LLM class flavin-dependent oxidoreductase [Rhizorhabdus dicambivorans]ATE65080.1 LLM class flavin-dependent oxidoreductase [Rhizorhabdus dicambivorans]PCE44354.1 LLM class flavin-dependent oxidoreductase [Rhizorhabdus dicambivorans]